MRRNQCGGGRNRRGRGAGVIPFAGGGLVAAAVFSVRPLSAVRSERPVSEHGRTIGSGRPSVRTPRGARSIFLRPFSGIVRRPEYAGCLPPGRAFGSVGDRPPCPCRNAGGRGPYDPVGKVAGRLLFRLFCRRFVSVRGSMSRKHAVAGTGRGFDGGGIVPATAERRCRRNRNGEGSSVREPASVPFPVSGCGGRIVYSGSAKSGKKIAQGVEK